MPSKRISTLMINERISQAQKARTRVACSTCRARRIKCDGQENTCSSCQIDNRLDCRYESVGSQERLAGRQRKRALRKKDQFTTSSAFTARNLPDTKTTQFIDLFEGEWPSNIIHSVISAAQPPPPYICSHAGCSSGGQSEDGTDGTSIFTDTHPLSHLFGASYHDETTRPSFSGSALTPSLALTETHLTNRPCFPWVPSDSPSHTPLAVNLLCYEPLAPKSLKVQPLESSGLEAKYTYVDVLWRDEVVVDNSDVFYSHQYAPPADPDSSCMA